MTYRRIIGSIGAFIGCIGLWGTVSAPARGADNGAVVDIVVHPDLEAPPFLFPQDAFMRRIKSHLLASPRNFVTAYVTIHTRSCGGKAFSAFAEVPLGADLQGHASYVFSDRLGHRRGTVMRVPRARGSVKSATRATQRADGSTLAIDLGNSKHGSIQLGLWGAELSNYTVNPTGNLIFGYLDGDPEALAVVTVGLDTRPEPSN